MDQNQQRSIRIGTLSIGIIGWLVKQAKTLHSILLDLSVNMLSESSGIMQLKYNLHGVLHRFFYPITTFINN